MNYYQHKKMLSNYNNVFDWKVIAKELNLDLKQIKWMSSFSSKELILETGLELRKKSDWKWWHFPLPLFFWIVGIFKPDLKKSYYERYYTMFVDCLYHPDHLDRDQVLQKMAVIFHEVQHFLDFCLTFALGYIFTKKNRAKWEIRGYFWNVYFQEEESRDVVVRALSGPMYGNMMSVEQAEVVFEKLLAVVKGMRSEQSWKEFCSSTKAWLTIVDKDVMDIPNVPTSVGHISVEDGENKNNGIKPSTWPWPKPGKLRMYE